MLVSLGFNLQGNAKVTEGNQHADRDAQFRYLAGQVAEQAGPASLWSASTPRRRTSWGPSRTAAGSTPGRDARAGQRLRLPRQRARQGHPLRHLRRVRKHRPGGDRRPPATRNQQMEQDRAPPVLPDHPELARTAADQPPSHRRPDRQHHHRNRPECAPSWTPANTPPASATATKTSPHYPWYGRTSTANGPTPCCPATRRSDWTSFLRVPLTPGRRSPTETGRRHQRRPAQPELSDHATN